MPLEVPFCDTPGQSVVVGLLSGAVGGLAGVAIGLGAPGVVTLAAALAIGGELLGHVVWGDQQFRAAIRQVRGQR